VLVPETPPPDEDDTPTLLLLGIKLDEDTADELETTEELLGNWAEELELLDSSGGGVGSVSEVQEKSSEAKSTTAKCIKRGDLVILGNIENFTKTA